MRIKKKKLLTYGGIVAAVLVVIVIIVGINAGKNDPKYVTAPVKYADINSTIQETGTFNPVDEVNVGTQVSGTVSEIYVDFNSIVHKGQVIARLDPTSFQEAADQANANLAVAQAQAAAGASTIAQNSANVANMSANEQQLLANVNAAKANVEKAAAQVNLSSVTVSRDHSLLAQGYIAQSQLDTDVATNASNEQALFAAQAALAAAQQQAKGGTAQETAAGAAVGVSRGQAAAAAAQVQVASAQAQQAGYNLSRTTITSPIDGIVVARDVSVGQTVAASLQTPTLFVIASSLKDMEVDVSVDEADVGQLRVGQAAQITVPAYPNTIFNGTVKQVRVNPTTVQNVVTYDAVVIVHDEQERLKPGMTANVTIDVVHRSNVLTVPMAALLYRPASARALGSGQGGSSGRPASGSSGSSASAATSSAPVAGAPGSHVTLWVLRKRQPVAAPVVIGYSDGSNVEIRQGTLQAGDAVITSEVRKGTTRAAAPGGFGFGGGRGG